MKQPLPILVLIFCLGIFFASLIKIPFWLIYSLTIVFLALSFLFIRRSLIFDICILCLAFTLGAALLKNSQNLPPHHISKVISYKKDQPYIIKGFIDGAPQIKGNKTYFIFKAQAIQNGNLNYRSCGNILVYLKSKKGLNYGDELMLRGFVRRQSHRNYLSNQGIWFMMRVKSDADMMRLNKNGGFILKKVAFWLKDKTEEMLFRHTTYLTAAVLDAMILGEKKNIPWFVNNAMMKSGTVHILPRLYTKMPSIAL